MTARPWTQAKQLDRARTTCIACHARQRRRYDQLRRTTTKTRTGRAPGRTSRLHRGVRSPGAWFSRQRCGLRAEGRVVGCRGRCREREAKSGDGVSLADVLLFTCLSNANTLFSQFEHYTPAYREGSTYSTFLRSSLRCEAITHIIYWARCHGLESNVPSTMEIRRLLNLICRSIQPGVS